MCAVFLVMENAHTLSLTEQIYTAARFKSKCYYVYFKKPSEQVNFAKTKYYQKWGLCEKQQ